MRARFMRVAADRGSASPTAARQTDLPGCKEHDNTDHRRIRARVEHTFAAMKTWKIRATAAGEDEASAGPPPE